MAADNLEVKSQKTDDKIRVAISWTGGKDSTLALHRVADDPSNSVVALVCFHPKNPDFRAHPLRLQECQAEALNLPLLKLEIDAAAHGGDYRQAYAACIKQLRTEHGIDKIATGDMDLVGTMPRNFITECCEIADCGMECLLPLWKADRDLILKELSDRGIVARMTCVKSPWFDASWIGRIIDSSAIEEMEKLHASKGLDMCGENGEYHSCVVDAPLFDKRLEWSDNVGVAERLDQQPGQKVEEDWWVVPRSLHVSLADKCPASASKVHLCT